MLEINYDELNTSLVDIILDSEYFAHLCGFKYPIGAVDKKKREGSVALKAETFVSNKNNKVIYGLMVWHNENYEPVIRFKEIGSTVSIDILNEPELPYPAIQRARAWMKGLEYYLHNKEKAEEIEELEKEAKKRFLVNIETNRR